MIFLQAKVASLAGLPLRIQQKKSAGACAKENREAKAGCVQARLVFARFFLMNLGKAGKDADSFGSFLLKKRTNDLKKWSVLYIKNIPDIIDCK